MALNRRFAEPEENLWEGRLGSDFENMDGFQLFKDEVELYLSRDAEERRSYGHVENKYHAACLAHCSRFRGFEGLEQVKAVREALDTVIRSNLMTETEATQIATLRPEDAEEAKALIPSLGAPDRGINEGVLQELLRVVHLKDFPGSNSGDGGGGGRGGGGNGSSNDSPSHADPGPSNYSPSYADPGPSMTSPHVFVASQASTVTSWDEGGEAEAEAEDEDYDDLFCP